MGEGVMIRKFQKPDIHRVADIWLSANREAHDFISAQYWEDHFESVKEMILQAEVYVYKSGNGTIQGFVGLSGDYIAGIFVCAEAQSNGIGSMLLNFVKNGKNRLSLDVYQKNIRAVKFYQREDFVIQSENMDDSTGEREYFMVWER